MGIDSIIAQNALPKESGTRNQVLGKDDFLKLMLLQMRHQDPLNPMNNEQMLSQMAQFSSLEQMSNLNKNFEQAQANTAFMDATRLLGKTVYISDGNGGLNQSNVEAISHSDQGPMLTLSNQQRVFVEDVLKVQEPVKE
jgi:flagellar basal-body rod modification protein FlgD